MLIAKWYTRASRVRIVIAKFDGRWKLPGGPYPIPELAALLAGILATLFLLPRLGQPVLTGVIGVCATAAAVGAMRRMPYSPVKFSTRIHRIVRLYANPVSTSADIDMSAGAFISAVRHSITILDAEPNPAPAGARRTQHLPHGPVQSDDHARRCDDLLKHPASTAAQLFG
jgi:hypothetical protein